VKQEGRPPLVQRAQEELLRLGRRGPFEWRPSAVNDSGRLTGLDKEHVYKLVFHEHDQTAHLRALSLEGEYELLRSCRGLDGVPSVLELHRLAEADMLVMHRVDGKPLAHSNPGILGRLIVYARLVRIVHSLARRGISHNDIHAGHVLVGPDLRVHLIDFDQATRAPYWTCVLRGLFGRRSRGATFGSVLTMLGEGINRQVRSAVARVVARMKARMARDGTSLPVLPENASPELTKMWKAWRIAQFSAASAPGRRTAYYSVDFEGMHLPGEREWQPRWDLLRQVTDFHGKRVLELGCNMGLLSTYLQRYGGARATLGIDIEKDILEAASLVAAAHGVAPNFARIDLDSSSPWESQLAAFEPDVVFALNVINWVEDKPRLLRFLAQHPVVVIEGHEPFEIERERLAFAGFSSISHIATSERGRPVIVCRR
jgi:2-polyprenyl-3-methyl-5-hydroxy-6-metoxy-1,4-benzoquinol methylase/predicted Ser/Thr protein kinase